MDHLQIKTKIHTIRNQRVILDFDLANLYCVETKYLNQSVKRNIQRFPIDFMFKLSNEEWQTLRLHFATSNQGGRRYMPYAFTEQGVAMLSGLLNSEIAIEMNIAIMRAFVAMRQSLSLQSSTVEIATIKNEITKLKAYIDEVFTDYNDINEDTRIQIELINTALAELQSTNKTDKNPRRAIGFHTERNSH